MARKHLGILGGMGPLASAEFLLTLYQHSYFRTEREAPACLLYSDPGIPDRTAAILSGNVAPLVESLSQAVEHLLCMKSHRVVITCITAHAVLNLLPERLRPSIISIIDLTMTEIEATPGRFLLLTTHGTRVARVFQDHPRWPTIEDRILLLEPDEQSRLHDWIYDLKVKSPQGPCVDWLGVLARSKAADGFVFGCTELHLLHRTLETRTEAPHFRIIDPLLITVRELPKLMA